MKSSVLRKISALCLMAVLLMCSASLAGCGSDTSSDIPDTAADAAAETTEETAAETSYLDTLPKTDMQGAAFRFAAQQGGTRINLPENTETGEPVNDALFTRNLQLESMYNISVVNIPAVDSSELTKLTETAILAGEDAFDVIFADMRNTSRVLTMDHALIAYDDIPYVDLSQHWWNRYNLTDLSIGGRVYFPTGVITPMYFKAPYAMMFNKRLAESYGIGNLYTVVDEGKWTLDCMAGHMKGVASDINGDGQMTLDDLYALVYDEVAGFAFYVGSGMKMVEFDADGLPTLVMGSARSVTVVDRLTSIVGDKAVCLRGEDYQKDAEFGVFQSGNALFAGQTLVRVSEYRDMTDDFGILPMPKYDEAQSEYYSYAQPWSGTGVAIPMTNRHVEDTGLLVETMAYLSDDYVRTAMYEVTYKGKLSRDNDTERMLDLITETASFDLNVIFDWGGSSNILRDCVLGNKENFTSLYAAVESKATTELNELREIILEND